MRYVMLRMTGSKIECVVVPMSQVKLVKKLMKNKKKFADFAEIANWKPAVVPRLKNTYKGLKLFKTSRTFPKTSCLKNTYKGLKPGRNSSSWENGSGV